MPLDAPGVRIDDNWRTMGMRATGSNDVTIEGVFVPEGAAAMRRPKGKWGRFFDVISPLVQPLIMSVYVGVAESARPLALAQAVKKRDDPIAQGSSARWTRTSRPRRSRCGKWSHSAATPIGSRPSSARTATKPAARLEALVPRGKNVH